MRFSVTILALGATLFAQVQAGGEFCFDHDTCLLWGKNFYCDRLIGQVMGSCKPNPPAEFKPCQSGPSGRRACSRDVVDDVVEDLLDTRDIFGDVIEDMLESRDVVGDIVEDVLAIHA